MIFNLTLVDLKLSFIDFFCGNFTEEEMNNRIAKRDHKDLQIFVSINQREIKNTTDIEKKEILDKEISLIQKHLTALDS